jgi:hypothetical protein
MGFLDNLESSLKSLESQEERDPGVNQRRQDDRSRALAIAPWADELRSSPYTQALFEKATMMGHRLRMKIYMAWFDSILRLEARGRLLELRPSADGIAAVFVEPDRTTMSEPLDLAGDPDDLLHKWLG